MNNIKRILEENEISYHKYQMTSDSARILFFFDNQDIIQVLVILKKIFGIYSFSPALRTSEKIEHIKKRSIEIANQLLKRNDTFALRVTRSGKHDYTSQDVAIEVGQAINDNFRDLNISVDLSNPDKTIFIEIRDQFSYIFTHNIKSTWHGLPIEGYKKIVAHDIGRIEDILAGFFLMRRGCQIYPFLFDNSGCNDSFRKRLKNWKILLDYTPQKGFKVKKIDLYNIIEALESSNIKKEYFCATCRLIRFEIISHIINQTQDKKLKMVRGISDGTNLTDLSPCFDEVDLQSIGLNYLFSEYPIYIPLVGLTEFEINEKIKKISHNFFEINYCKFKPKNQKIKLDEMKSVYNSLEIKDIFKKVIEGIEDIYLTKN
jgi:thiamine biosynthesis protein ThiI